VAQPLDLGANMQREKKKEGGKKGGGKKKGLITLPQPHIPVVFRSESESNRNLLEGQERKGKKSERERRE